MVLDRSSSRPKGVPMADNRAIGAQAHESTGPSPALRRGFPVFLRLTCLTPAFPWDPMNAQFHDATGASAHFPSNRLTAILCAVFLVGVWLLARPYAGIRHDGILYVGQALLQLYPDIYSRDVFFAHGSQDSYSIFSPIYAWLIAHIGLPASALLLVILGQIAFLSSLALLAGQFLKGRDLWLGLVFVAIMPGFYGGLQIFSYAENFVTARTFAEPISLFALYRLCRRRWIESALLFAIGAAVHPLIVLPAIAAAWVHLSRARPVGWWLALVVLIAPGLALFNIPPFDLLSQTFDSDWLLTVDRNSEHLFLRHWKLGDWAVLAYDFATLTLARRHAEGNLKSAIESVLAVGLGAVIATGVFADLLGSVFFTALQVWRALWLLHLVAMALTPWFYLRIFQGDVQEHGLLIVGLLYLSLVGSRYPGALMALALAGLFIWHGRNISVSPWVRRFGLAAVLAGIASVTFKDLKAHSYLASKPDSFSDMLSLAIQGLTRPAGLTILALGWLQLAKTRGHLTSAVAAVTALALGVWSYDQRSPWAAFVENGLELKHPFADKLSPKSQVYWQGETYGLLGTWLLLKHPSYLTRAQGAGVTFDRETARHYGEREEAFAALTFQESICAIMNSLDDRHCAVDVEALKEICSLPQSPDYLIIESRIPDLVEAEWRFEVDGSTFNTFYLYRCNRIRSGA